MELLSVRNGIYYDHSRSEVRRSRSQDHIFLVFFLRKISGRMRLVRPSGGAHACALYMYLHTPSPLQTPNHWLFSAVNNNWRCHFKVKRSKIFNPQKSHREMHRRFGEILKLPGRWRVIRLSCANTFLFSFVSKVAGSTAVDPIASWPPRFSSKGLKFVFM